MNKPQSLNIKKMGGYNLRHHISIDPIILSLISRKTLHPIYVTEDRKI